MANPALLTYRDGSFSGLDVTDGVYFENFEEWPGLQVWHVPYAMDLDAYNALGGAPAIGSLHSPWGYFFREPPWRYLGDNLISFERQYHNLPGDQNRPVSVTKNYQAGQYTFGNGVIVAMAINSFSRAIKANCNYHYALDNPGTLPVVPFIQMIPYLSGQAMTDLGTGFPHTTFNPPTGGSFVLPNNNYASSNLDGASITHIFGNLYCRKILTG